MVPALYRQNRGNSLEPSFQARAIETQSYILAPAQVGYHRDPVKRNFVKAGVKVWQSIPGESFKGNSNYKEFWTPTFQT